MDKTVDSYRFISGITKRMIKTWIGMEQSREIPWTPLAKPLADCKVSLISSAGIALKTDQPFDQEGERRNPWWGDPSYRILPSTATSQDVRLYHLHIDPRYAEQDLNCLFPLTRLQELAAIQTPGGVVHLPFEWPEPPKQVRNRPPEDPPIGRYLARNPWFLPKLRARNVPA